MAAYDGVVGIDEPALNQFVQSVYQAVHDEVLRGTVTPNLPNVAVTSIDYDIASVPRITLAPSQLVRAMRREMIAGLGVAEEALDKAADAQSRASFGLSIETLAVALHYADGSVTQLQAAAHAGLEVTVETNGEMTPSLVTLVIEVSGNPALSEIINHGLVPELMNLIERTFLTPIRVPPLGLGSVQVSPPVVATGQGRLLATTALAPTVPDPAELAGAWPRDTVFAAFDATILSALANSQLAGRTFPGSWEEKSISVTATYEATASNAALEVVPGGDGQLRGTADLKAFANLKAFGIFSFSADVTAKATVRATVSITGDNQVVVNLDGLDSVDFEFDFRNVPFFLDWILNRIADAFGPQIKAALNTAFAGLPAQPITKIPQILIPFQGKIVVITLKGLDVATLQTPDDKTLLAVTGGADVAVPLPATRHTVRNEGREITGAHVGG